MQKSIYTWSGTVPVICDRDGPACLSLIIEFLAAARNDGTDEMPDIIDFFILLTMTNRNL